MKDFKKFTDDDFDVNKFIDENWEKIQEGAERIEKMLQEMYGEEKEKFIIVYDDIEN